MAERSNMYVGETLRCTYAVYQAIHLIILHFVIYYYSPACSQSQTRPTMSATNQLCLAAQAMKYNLTLYRLYRVCGLDTHTIISGVILLNNPAVARSALLLARHFQGVDEELY